VLQICRGDRDASNGVTRFWYGSRIDVHILSQQWGHVVFMSRDISARVGCDTQKAVDYIGGNPQ
jgi:hypothetical protein